MASGWNRPTGSVKPMKKKSGSSPLLKGIVAGLVVCVGAFAALYFLSGGESGVPAKDSKSKKTIKEVKPVKAAHVDEQKAHESEILEEFGSKVREYIKKPLTNNVELVGLKPLDPKDPDNALRTKFARDIANLLAIPPGMPVPKFLVFGFMIDGDFEKTHGDGGNKQFLENMKKWKIAVKEGDSEARMQAKANLIDNQLSVLESIENGGTVNDVVRDAYKFRVEAAEVRTHLIESIKELHGQDRDMKLTRDLVKQANEQLKEQGIVEITDDDVFDEEDFESEEKEKENGANEEAGN